MLEEEGYKVGGILTEEVLEDGKRVGFSLMDWITKEKKVFAHNDFDTHIKIGRYGIDVDILDEIAVKALEVAKEESDIIIIDEIGKMEVESKSFVSIVKETLDVNKNMIITLHKKSRNALLQDIRRRDDIRILEVTPINRHLLPFKIVRLVKGDQI
jgi:nucleoside-triphosphatase